MSGWSPIGLEDRLLYEYWKEVGSILYLEVPVVLNSDIVEWPRDSIRSLKTTPNRYGPGISV